MLRTARRVCFIAIGLLAQLVTTVFGQGLSPDEALKRMKVADGFEVSVVASEPLVRQPVAIEFDDRGRLWVIQYLQYPNPEGLKRVQVDRFSRTKYDRVPDPPPKGPRGADRITILEDTDSDGRMDRGKDFIDGLNLTTGIAFGHGGLFVLNVPYLLFYPDKNRDDVPDGDPEVLLSGFGMEDAHSVANSLTFGPDGWLYGCQGSTVTANVRGIEFQQGVWRYHPLTRAFELFCEGGGNSWGLDFDRAGHLLYSTNWGGHVLLHGVQGAYLVKAFAKHGALHNPHAYGFFDHAPHKNFRGGHVTVGGIVYQGDSFPASFRGKYIAGDLLGHGVYWHDIEPRGSTFQTAHGGELLVANDPWFAPTDVTMGPDGAIYVSDWHDSRTAHPDPDAEWDRSNGRIYRIAAKGTKPAAPIDFAKLSDDELLKLHSHRSQWNVRHARQELARRSPPPHDATASGQPVNDHSLTRRAIVEKLQQAALSIRVGESAALEALWSLNACGGFNEALAFQLLDSPYAAVRMWTVRLLGDPQKAVSTEMAHRLDDFAEQDTSVAVRMQLACTAARLPANQALPIINANINRDIDNADPFVPLLWWWAVERHSVSTDNGVDGRNEVMKRFVRPSLWKSKLGSQTLLPRLLRRYAARGTPVDHESCLKLIQAAPNETERDQLSGVLLTGWREAPRKSPSEPAPLSSGLAAHVLARWNMKPDDNALLAFALALREPAAYSRTLREILNSQTNANRRVALLGLFADCVEPDSVEPLLGLTVMSNEPESVRSAALATVSRVSSEEVTSRLLTEFSLFPPNLKTQGIDVLLSRKASAAALLKQVDRGDLKPSELSVDQVRRFALFEDAEVGALVTKHWGKLNAATREEKLAEVRRLNNDLRATGGNIEAGKAVFKKHCAACHQIFGEGTKLGPDLTAANRKDRDYLLISLVDPSVVIRKEFLSHIVQTRDGRVLNGLVIERNDAGLTIANAKNERVTLAIADIEELRESPISLMPDDLYRQLKPQELRDLFAYLAKD
ncbi:MAG: c-type cytochrome [Planctomycetes bacterium]|nr:c-type cytochrome [Planctomycetota bacterium]